MVVWSKTDLRLFDITYLRRAESAQENVNILNKLNRMGKNVGEDNLVNILDSIRLNKIHTEVKKASQKNKVAD